MISEKWRSSIKPSLKRSLLWRGSFLAALGIALLIYAGTTFPVTSLQFWGPLFFFGGGSLIVIGLLPYRKICRLEHCPYELYIGDRNHLCFLQGGKPLLDIPFNSIRQIGYLDNGNHYGVLIWLKQPLPDKIFVYSSSCRGKFRLVKIKNSMEKGVFLPYFSERSFNSITSCL